MSKKKSVAILTQTLGHNYGGIIQNFALQKVLRGLSYDVVTINRAEDNPHSKLKIVASGYKSLFFRYVLRQNKVTFLDVARVCRNTNRFVKHHIKRSSTLTSTAAIQNFFLRKRFHAVIVGSDQVWRPKYSPNILNYFLDFLSHEKSIRKISYAASFGTEEWEFTLSETERCAELLKHFDAVSVREGSAVALCKKYLNRQDVKHVLDPTLLLRADDYSKLIADDIKDIGLFTYILDHTDQKSEFIDKSAAELDLKIYSNQAKQTIQNLSLDNIADCILPSVEGWLQGFRDAEFVITDSFHGTVFSIINQKPFFALVNSGRGAARFESLLGEFGLLDRLIYEPAEFDLANLSTPIDYEHINKKLEVLKVKSLQFLKESLQC